MPRNTKENAELTRQHLLDVAQHLFATQGIASTSLDQVAKEANVTRGAVYWHFRDKTHLLQEIYKRFGPINKDLRAKAIQEAETDPALALWHHSHRILTIIRDNEVARCVTSIVLLRDEGDKALLPAIQMDIERHRSALRAIIGILNLAAERKQLQADTNIQQAGLALQATQRGAAGMLLALPQHFNETCQITDLLKPFYRGILTPAVWQTIKSDKDY